jgi:hypothetical protein
MHYSRNTLKPCSGQSLKACQFFLIKAFNRGMAGMDPVRCLIGGGVLSLVLVKACQQLDNGGVAETMVIGEPSR